MAEVLMRPTMLQSHSSSADVFQPSTAGQNYQPQHTPRSMYSQQKSSSGYRGPSATPVQPYAFQSTPQLRQETRTISSPMAGNTHQAASHAKSNSASTTSSGSASSPVRGATRTPSRDDTNAGARLGSFINLSSSIPDLSLTNFDSPPKASPDRYRRSPRSGGAPANTPSQPVYTSPAPPGPGMTSVEHLYQPQPSPAHTTQRTTSDDSSKAPDSSKRYRRKSSGIVEGSNSNHVQAPLNPQGSLQSTGIRTVEQSASSSPTIRPVNFYDRSRTLETIVTRHGSPQPTSPSPDSVGLQEAASSQVSLAKTTTGPLDSHKRYYGPSPLSQSTYNGEARPRTANSALPSTVGVRPGSSNGPVASLAAQQLAALSDKDLNKVKKSRLRRAFSFGSASELRKASENINPVQPVQMSKTPEETEAEQAAIARKQEAAGIGAGIYSGQGNFSGSTDNLSISSTASSASLMLRKMGNGVKRSGRSLKGLFRPKSVIGVPAADGPVQPSLAQVSMVTVEAERQNVNVNAHPADQVGGGTGFPKLENNSLDAAQRQANQHADSRRKSMAGSEREGAESLAAAKKGILKRSGTSSPALSPVLRPRDADALTSPGLTHSPSSSVPGTPRDERQSRSLTSNTSAASSSDYFAQRRNLSGVRSMPSTPHGLSRRTQFSPRIQFHDVWSSTEYDRRGDIATCNRLTPMLAQQIKEELNTFKMEMAVHEHSRVHTHFF